MEVEIQEKWVNEITVLHEVRSFRALLIQCFRNIPKEPRKFFSYFEMIPLSRCRKDDRNNPRLRNFDETSTVCRGKIFPICSTIRFQKQRRKGSGCTLLGADKVFESTRFGSPTAESMYIHTRPGCSETQCLFEVINRSPSQMLFLYRSTSYAIQFLGKFTCCDP